MLTDAGVTVGEPPNAEERAAEAAAQAAAVRGENLDADDAHALATLELARFVCGSGMVQDETLALRVRFRVVARSRWTPVALTAGLRPYVTDGSRCPPGRRRNPRPAGSTRADHLW